MAGDKCVGPVICKLAIHKSKAYRGYIAMLAVDKTFRKRRIGKVQDRQPFCRMPANTI